MCGRFVIDDTWEALKERYSLNKHSTYCFLYKLVHTNFSIDEIKYISMIIKYQRFLPNLHWIAICLFVILSALQAEATTLCTRGLLPTESEYIKAEKELRELDKSFDHQMNIGMHRPGDAQFTPYAVKLAENERTKLREKHLTNLRTVQLPKHLKNCIESNYSYEKLKELFDKWYIMASLYLESQNYVFNEKLTLQLMILKTLK